MTFTTLISVAELVQNLANPSFVILDCRADLSDVQAGANAFAEGHIPGARHVNLDLALSDKSRGPNGEFRGRHPLPEKAAFIETLRRLGVRSDSQVVTYDAQGSMYAARAWWMLRWVGHEAVAVLDGGLPGWTAAGMPLSMENPEHPRGDIELRAPLVESVSADDILSRPSLQVIDARSPDRFRGENETLDPVGGHIPGARNRFFKDNLDANGRFKPADELRAALSTLAPDPGKTVMQCGSGVTACHNLLAMEVAGLPGAALYPGSWSEWCSDSRRPVATGPAD